MPLCYSAISLSQGKKVVQHYDPFIKNWELTFREYPDLLTGPENWKQIEKYSINLQRYLEFIRSKHLKMLESQRQGG